jgi:RNA polymerase sigma-70 factor (ECF subfamily)
MKTPHDVTESGISLAPEQSTGVSDARLLEECRQGHKNSFGQLVQRYEKRLWKVVYRFVRDRELADDLTQETFLRAYERLDQFDPSRRFGPWLFRIGVNLTLDFLRKRKRRGWISMFSEMSVDHPIEPVTADVRDEEDIKQEVRQVLDEIPEKYRTVLILRDLENFSTTEISAILDRKEATVRWRLAEARQQFQKLWIKRHTQPSS